MTTTLERPAQQSGAGKRTRVGRGKNALVAPVLPQVNLLPPEVVAKRTLSRVKRWLAAMVVLAVLVAAGMVTLAVITAQAAEQELALQQQTTERLLEEQKKYAEVPIVLGQLDGIKTAREMTMSTEIFWREYLAAVAATAPAGVSIESVTVMSPSPMEPPGAPLSPLDQPAVGTLTFTANSLTVPDTAAWMDGLQMIPGMANAWFTSATITESEDLAYYSVSGTVQVTVDAQTKRFVVEKGEQ